MSKKKIKGPTKSQIDRLSRAQDETAEAVAEAEVEAAQPATSTARQPSSQAQAVDGLPAAADVPAPARPSTLRPSPPARAPAPAPARPRARTRSVSLARVGERSALSKWWSERVGSWRLLVSTPDLRNRLLISLGLLVLYRLTAHVPVPGVNREIIAQVLGGGGAAGNLINLLDLLSGGTVANFSVLAMGVYPYITAQIILQLLVPIIPALQRRMEEDPRTARQFMERWTYFLAIPMSALQAIGQVRLFDASTVGLAAPVVPNLGWNLPTVTMIITMTAGTMFAIWLGELISEYGLRNQGLSLIILSGIVARIPSNLARILADPERRWMSLGIFLGITAVTVFAIVYVQQGRRNVRVMYPGKRMGHRQSMPVEGKLPLMVNMAGMIPLIFAQSILTFPAVIAGFFSASPTEWVRNAAASAVNLFGGTSPWYWPIYFVMVVAFTYFYTDVIFQQQNYGDNLKRSGAQVPGVVEGKQTQEYLNKVLRRITLPGALLLGLVAVLPFLVHGVLPVRALLITGAGLLIVVGTVRDVLFNLEAELKLRGYDNVMLIS